MQRALVELARQGDEDAFAALAAAAGDRLLAIAYRILRDLGLAEDAVQATLVTAWRELRTLRDVDRFEAWLRRLLVHACYTEARRAARWRAHVRSLPEDLPSDPEEVAAIVRRDEIDRAFLRLPPEQRAVVVFHHYLGLTLTEIADELGIPVGTVKSRLHYAYGGLRAAIEADARAVSLPLGGGLA